MKNSLALKPSLSNLHNKLEELETAANYIWEITAIICGSILALMIAYVIISKLINT